MNSENAAFSPPPLPPGRSVFVTMLSWTVIVLSALALPISGITCLMVMAKSYGTQTSDPLGFFQIVILPPAGFVTGIGLLRRRWLAWFCFVTLLIVMATTCLFRVMRGPTPERVTYSPTGVKTTVMASGTGTAQAGLVFWAALIAWMLSPRVRAEFSRPRDARPRPGIERRWMEGHRGCESMHEDDAGGSPPPLNGFQTGVTRDPPSPGVIAECGPEPASRRVALWLIVVFFLGVGAGMFWLVTNGVETGETIFPGKRASQHRAVLRSEEPATFWMSIGLYAVIGAGSSCFSLWLVREALRRR